MAIAFDGSTQWLTTATGTTPITGEPMSSAAWFYPTTSSQDAEIATIVPNTGTTGAFRLFYGGSGASGSVEFISRKGGQRIAISTTAATVNAWNHAVGHVNATHNSRSAYVNGGSKGTNTDSWDVTEITSSTHRISIGAFRSDATYNPLAGRIAEVAFWNRVLTDAEVASLSKGFSPLFFQAGLVFYAPLRNTADARDLIGGLSLSLTGSPTDAVHPRIIYPAPVFYSFPSAGGDTFNQTATDSLNLSDTASETAAFSVSTSETLNLADAGSELADFVETLAEALNLADTAGGTTAMSKAVAEALNLSDSASETAAFAANIAESLSLLDTATRTAIINRALADSLSLVDTVSGTTGISAAVSESLVLTDTSSEIAAFLRSVSDVLSLTDTAAKASWTGTRAAIDSLSLIDSASAVGGEAVSTTKGGLSLSEKRMRELEKLQMLQRDDDEIIALITRLLR